MLAMASAQIHGRGLPAAAAAPQPGKDDFTLLIAAIVWNLATWALDLPNSSSHALIGSIIG